MAQNGHCCRHASDCMSGICISGACWPEPEHDDHLFKTIILLLSVAVLILCACLTISCCWHRKNIQMQIKFETKEMTMGTQREKVYEIKSSKKEE